MKKNENLNNERTKQTGWRLQAKRSIWFCRQKADNFPFVSPCVSNLDSLSMSHRGDEKRLQSPAAFFERRE
jgi:hypothetical protein